jgi:hypothetical protein
MMVVLTTPSGLVEVGKEESEEVPNDYSVMTAGIVIDTKELTGLTIENEHQARALEMLTNMYIGSEYVFNQLKEFVTMNWDQALLDTADSPEEAN